MRADALLGVEGIHVSSVTATGTGLVLRVETGETVTGRPAAASSRAELTARAVGWATDALQRFRHLGLRLGPPARSLLAHGLGRGQSGFTAGIKTAALDPFRGYANTIRDELPDAITVLDAIHVVKLGSSMVDEIRRRVQQDTLGHRGRTGDPLYGIRRTLQIGAEHLTEKQAARLEAKLTKSPWPGSATKSSATSTVEGDPWTLDRCDNAAQPAE